MGALKVCVPFFKLPVRKGTVMLYDQRKQPHTGGGPVAWVRGTFASGVAEIAPGEMSSASTVTLHANSGSYQFRMANGGRSAQE